MDESWRMRMGIPSSTTQQFNHPRRRSTEDISHRRRTISGEADTTTLLLDPEDFNDVFGGPPRIVMSRQFSGCNSFSRSSFYEEIFRPAENVCSAGKVVVNGRNLPEFKIPAGRGGRRSDQGFYSDIFGWDEEEVRRSRTRSGSKSKASSSSALSSEELSPLQAAVGGGGIGDDDVSLFASRLRPINVPCRWSSTRMTHEERQRQEDMPFSWNNPTFHVQNDYNDNFRSSHFGFCPGNSSPESIVVEPNSSGVVNTSADDFEPNSPSSAVSSICQDQEAMAGKAHDETMQDQEEDEVMNSYVIEINCDNREGTDDAIGVDEAIAWAKEKFQKHCSENTWITKHSGKEQFAEPEEMVNREQITERQKIDGHGLSEAPENGKLDVCITEEETRKMVKNMEMELLDKNVRLWSTGKEADIRLLLSTLHHILWPNSGWLSVPLASLIESSHVKKAYQKARLCLHPDKLQQRGATLPQKYVAEKAFSILQEAWAAFISRDVF